MLTIVKLGIGLLLLIISNIALGSINAILDKEFDWKKFFHGVIKGLVVVLVFVAVYFAGWLNPTLFVIDIDGQQMNLQMATYAILLAGFAYYAYHVIMKLKDIVTKGINNKPEEGGENGNGNEQK